MTEGKLLVQGDYVGVAIDEPSVRQSYLGERKKEFSFSFITAEEVQQVAEEILAANRLLKVYYTCKVRGNPYINLLDKCVLTAPKCSVTNLQCQIIRIDHTVEAGHWTTLLGMVAEVLLPATIMHLDKDPSDHLDAGYYIDQTK